MPSDVSKYIFTKLDSSQLQFHNERLFRKKQLLTALLHDVIADQRFGNFADIILLFELKDENIKPTDS